jgi:prepilin-type N-terminal cleavage/methylation domain-containing protein
MIGMYRSPTSGSSANGRRGFTLIELLVVVGIIGLLVAILLPSFGSARNAAKGAKTSSDLKNIATGLAMFKNDNERQYSRSNGYPASSWSEDQAVVGEQRIYGAHWLVRSLVGGVPILDSGGSLIAYDYEGFVPRRIVPQSVQLIGENSTTFRQEGWYGNPEISRIPTYIPAESSLRSIPTGEIEGNPPAIAVAENVALHPVFIDSFDAPILYYASNKFGKILCPSQGDASKLYYNHVDNEVFTGSNATSPNIDGWQFKRTKLRDGVLHPIQNVCPGNLDNIDSSDSWGHYIENETHASGTAIASFLRPYNQDSYLLISAGPDNAFGTPDDVTNINR